MSILLDLCQPPHCRYTPTAHGLSASPSIADLHLALKFGSVMGDHKLFLGFIFLYLKRMYFVIHNILSNNVCIFSI